MKSYHVIPIATRALSIGRNYVTQRDSTIDLTHHHHVSVQEAFELCHKP